MKGETMRRPRGALSESLARIKLLAEAMAWTAQARAARAAAERIASPRERSAALAAAELLAAATERAAEGDAAALPSLAEHAMELVGALTTSSSRRVKDPKAKPRDLRVELRVVKDLAVMAERALQLAPKRARA